MVVQPIQTRIFTEGEPLVDFVIEHVPVLTENTIVVVTSKIVALAEGRTVEAVDQGTKERLIKQESDRAWPTKYVWLTVTDGMLMANAGIDESNAKGKLILLPKDSFVAAEKVRLALGTKFNLKNLGVLITDSRTTPLRAGVTGAALGYAGFCGVRDYRQSSDLFGRPFKFSQTNVADCLASAAVLTMGEGNECQPLAIITDAPVEFKNTIDREEGKISLEDDMYMPLLLPVASDDANTTNS